ncbi:hypothetical protein OG417_18890 [Actinoallomurus sp. NBC_01490]|uniref:hypothetical protein n=1 Tax=Actinoallomurus sp. NBC_01490 TaxID=2903557 RepID=UPI002E34A05C|nr:hypothetical protein [Actinoallomurus sp. NBC_01490]
MISWAGPAADLLNLSADGTRNPTAIWATVATPPRPPSRRDFVPPDLPPTHIAIATREDDDRPSVAAYRHAAHHRPTTAPTPT